MKNKIKLVSKIFYLMLAITLCTLQPFRFMEFNSIAEDTNTSLSSNYVDSYMIPMYSQTDGSEYSENIGYIIITKTVFNKAHSLNLGFAGKANMLQLYPASLDNHWNADTYSNILGITSNCVYDYTVFFRDFDFTIEDSSSIIIPDYNMESLTVSSDYKYTKTDASSSKGTHSIIDNDDEDTQNYLFSYDKGKTWTSNSKLQISKDGLYDVYVKDKYGNINVMKYEYIENY